MFLQHNVDRYFKLSSEELICNSTNLQTHVTKRNVMMFAIDYIACILIITLKFIYVQLSHISDKFTSGYNGHMVRPSHPITHHHIVSAIQHIR